MVGSVDLVKTFYIKLMNEFVFTNKKYHYSTVRSNFFSPMARSPDPQKRFLIFSGYTFSSSKVDRFLTSVSVYTGRFMNG